MDKCVCGIAAMPYDFDGDVCHLEEQHSQLWAEILLYMGFPAVDFRAVLSDENHTGVSRDSPVGRALFHGD